MLWRVAGALLALQAGVSTAVVNNKCSGDSATKIDDGITDAIKMANTAIQTLQTQMNNEIFAVPFLQLFPPNTQNSVIGIYTQIAVIRSSEQVVNFYCDEDHVVWRGDLNSWIDNQYTYTENGNTMPLVYNMHLSDSSTKPGQQKGGSSYTTLGYKIQASPGQFADCSDQAHVFINAYRLNPPDGAQDTRPIDTIVNDGLDPRFNSLDTIHPLSHSILHELVHAVGGLADAQQLSSGGEITDGLPNKEVYGLDICFKTNINAQKLPGSTSTLSFADPYAILAKEYYLQLKKNAYGVDHTGPVLWALGAVDPDTLAPIGLPGS